jgi:hypothetical protein
MGETKMRPGQPFLEAVHALVVIVVLVPACRTLSAQEAVPISARVLISARETVPINPDKRPTWMGDGVPDSVWMLVEESWTVDDKDRRKEILRRAEIHARAAGEGHPQQVGPRFALAVVLASRSDTEGGGTKVRTAAEFHRELEMILEIDPQHARAHHMTGRLYAGVRRANRIARWIATNLLGGAELKKATWQAAEEHLSYAEEHAPEVSSHHLQLANLYADTDRLELALLELEHVFPLPVVSPIEQIVWDEALEVKEEWKQELERELAMQGCRKVGARTRRPRTVCK